MEEAEATLDPSQQLSVYLVFTGEGIDRFNQVAQLCFSATEGICPTGLPAILVDGAVVTAPSIQSPSFLRDQIQISGNFSQDEAGHWSPPSTAVASLSAPCSSSCPELGTEAPMPVGLLSSALGRVGR